MNLLRTCILTEFARPFLTPLETAYLLEFCAILVPLAFAHEDTYAVFMRFCGVLYTNLIRIKNRRRPDKLYQSGGFSERRFMKKKSSNVYLPSESIRANKILKNEILNANFDTFCANLANNMKYYATYIFPDPPRPHIHPDGIRSQIAPSESVCTSLTVTRVFCFNMAHISPCTA